MDNIKRMDERQAALHEHFPSTHYLHKQENVMRLMLVYLFKTMRSVRRCSAMLIRQTMYLS